MTKRYYSTKYKKYIGLASIVIILSSIITILKWTIFEEPIVYGAKYSNYFITFSILLISLEYYFMDRKLKLKHSFRGAFPEWIKKNK